MSFDVHYGVDGTPFYVRGRPEPIREPTPPRWKSPFDLPRMNTVDMDRHARRMRNLQRRLGARQFKRYLAAKGML